YPFDKMSIRTGVKEGREVFGLPPVGEITREMSYAMIHPDDREWVKRAFEHAVEAGEDYEVEHRLVSPNGEVRWVRSVGRCFHDPTGQPHHFDGVFYDITRRKRQEEERERLLAELSLAEERLRMVVEAAHLFVWQSDYPFDKFRLRTGERAGRD